MFEKFDIDSLYRCYVDDIVPMGMSNFGGVVSIDYASSNKYETVVCLRNGKYYDINNLNRILNVVKFPQKGFPITSKDNHLYIVDEESLVSLRDEISIEYSVLQRLPFGKHRYIR